MWREFITKINGPLPISPILTNFLKVHEPTDVTIDEKWKTWELPTDHGVSSLGNSDDIQDTYLPRNVREPTRRIVHQPIDDGVDFGGETESNQSGTDSDNDEIQQPPPPATREEVRQSTVELRPRPETKEELKEEESDSYASAEPDLRPRSKTKARKETKSVVLVENRWARAYAEQDWKKQKPNPITVPIGPEEIKIMSRELGDWIIVSCHRLTSSTQSIDVSTTKSAWIFRTWWTT